MSAAAVLRPRKPAVALVVDSESWAFANIARQLMQRLSEHYVFRMIPASVIENVDQLLMMTADADLRHFFWREIPRQIGTPHYRYYVERLGCDYEDFEDRYLRGRKLTTAVYDHLMLSEGDVAERAAFYSSPLLDGYSVSSKRLCDIYASLPGYPPPLAVLEDGVDLEVFAPRRPGRLLGGRNRDLVIGWVGNSAWNAEIEDFKGVRTVLRPSLHALRARGIAVRGYFADRRERFIPHAQMPEYYAQIDILVCTSSVEGTPNPVLEAMASGVPVVTTDVGVVPQLFGPLQQRFILPERSVSALVERIAELSRHRVLLRELSLENLDYIRDWGWDTKVRDFKAFFDQILHS